MRQPPKKKIIKKVGRKKIVIEPIEGVYSNAIDFAAECFRHGDSEQVIAEEVKLSWPILTDANIQLVIHKGSKIVAHQFARDSRSIVSLHVKRYNQEIDKLLAKTYEGLIDEVDIEGEMTASLRRKLRINCLMICMDVMVQKERVLQLHSKETQVKVFNTLNAKIKEKKVLFNLESLSLQEKIEFLQLIQKAKKNSNELMSVILNSKKQEVTEDIEHEEVRNNNIDSIKLINPPEVIKVRPKKGLDDITKKLHEALAKKAEIEFKKKNGHNGEPKAIDYTEINDK